MRAAVRTRQDTHRTGGILYFYGNGSSRTDVYVDQRNTATYWSSISDVPGRRVRKYDNTAPYNPVSHIKMHLNLGSGLNAGEWRNDNYPLDRVIISHGVDFDPLHLDRNVFPNVTNAERSALHSRAFKHWSTRFPKGISLANFIYELRDIKSLFQKNISQKTISSSYLIKEFGWLPLFSDLVTFSTIIQDTIKRLKYLRKTAGKWTKVSYFERNVNTEWMVPSRLLVGAPALLESYDYDYHEKIMAQTYAAVYRAEALVYQDFGALPDDIALLTGFASALGLFEPAKVVWNALPYSFIADWFLRLDGLLNRLALDPYESDFVVKPLGWSIKEEGTAKSFVRWKGAVHVSNMWRPVGDMSISRYNRSALFDVLPEELTKPGLTPNHQAILLALIHQRIPSRNLLP